MLGWQVQSFLEEATLEMSYEGYQNTDKSSLQGGEMKYHSGKSNNTVTNWYVWGTRGRGKVELEREHRRRDCVLYSETYGTTEGFYYRDWYDHIWIL